MDEPVLAGEGAGRPDRWRRVVLLGFMTSGKTRVGRALAARLGWTHIDLDLEIRRSTGMSIEEIFAAGGEEAFRALEVENTPRVLAREHVVLSPGGGWITNRGLFDSLPGGTLTVWLKVSPSEVVRRLAAAKGQPIRPLLQAGDPRARVEEILAGREPLYRRAALTIDTDRRSVGRVADQIATVVRRGGPGPNPS